MKTSSFLLNIFILLNIVGCATTSPQTKVVPLNPEIGTIQVAFDEIVEEVYARENEKWRHGPFGNFIIYWRGGNNRGWCHEWQDLVYKKIRSKVYSVGWELDKISVGFGTPKEHHVVLVYNPEVLTKDRITADPFSADAYVLDAWFNGRPDIYLLKDWLAFAYDGKPDFEYE